MLTWANVKEKLRQNDTFYILDFLMQIVEESEVNEICMQIGRFSDNEREKKGGMLTQEEHSVYSNRIRGGVLDTMKNMSDEHLKKGWQTFDIIVDLFNQDENGQSKIIYSNANITLEKTLIQVPDTPGLEASKNKHKFKIELMRAQDLIIMKNYSEAYDCCKKVNEKLEMESPQLYEFMLLTYFHKERVEEIIKDVFEGEGGKLKLIQLYAERCFTLNDMIKGKQKGDEKEVKGLYASETVNGTITNILTNLAENINQKYENDVKYDCTLTKTGNKKKNMTEDKARRFFVNFYDVVNDLTNRFYTQGSETNIDIDNVLIKLLDNVLHELNGGNTLDWFELDYNRKPKNKTQFGALAAREAIITAIKRIKGNKYEAFQTQITDRLYQSLVFKCNSIYLLRSETVQQKSAIVRLIESCLIAYAFYKEERFLDIALDELICEDLKDYAKTLKKDRYAPFEGKKNLGNWFSLSPNAELIVRDKALGRRRDILADLEYMLNVCWDKEKDAIIESLKQRLATEILAHCALEYAQIKAFVQVPPHERERERVARCLSYWYACYKILEQADILDCIIKELIGAGTSYCWFDFSEDGRFDNNFETKQLDPSYNACGQLENILRFKFAGAKDELLVINKQIYESIYKDIVHKYARLTGRMNNGLRKNELIHLIKRCENGHYHHLTADDRFIDLARTNLSNDTHVNWLFYLKLTNKFINENFKRLVSELPAMKTDFLAKIIDMEKARLSESAYQPKAAPKPEEDINILDLLLGQKSLVLYLFFLVIFGYSYAFNEKDDAVFYGLMISVVLLVFSICYHWFFKEKINPSDKKEAPSV